MPCNSTVWTPSWTDVAHFASISCVRFSSPGNWYLFCDTRSQIFCLLQVCLSFFSRSFFQEKVLFKIIGNVDIMLTLCSANCNYFYELFFKKDQLRSTIFNSIANYIFPLWKAIYSVVLALICLSQFLKNMQEVKRGANLSVFIKRTFGVGRSAILNQYASAVKFVHVRIAET